MKINHKSDFKLTESHSDLSTPFRFTYSTSSGNQIVASYIDEQFTNCRPSEEEGELLVIFDNHHLGVGQLKVVREYFLSDQDFKDGICNKVTHEILDVHITWEATTEVDFPVEVAPAYCKGDRGEKGDKGERGDKGEKGDKGITELMSFSIIDDNLYVSQADQSNIDFTINNNGELIATWE